jgi:tRNA dimethylallyltransferase
MKPRPIAVIGPTGTGKSVLALEVAERLGGEIVNADAMQQYRCMDIGTAKLSPAERRGIPHHQLDVLDVTETATVARYQQAAVADSVMSSTSSWWCGIPRRSASGSFAVPMSIPR